MEYVLILISFFEGKLGKQTVKPHMGRRVLGYSVFAYVL